MLPSLSASSTTNNNKNNNSNSPVLQSENFSPMKRQADKKFVKRKRESGEFTEPVVINDDKSSGSEDDAGESDGFDSLRVDQIDDSPKHINSDRNKDYNQNRLKMQHDKGVSKVESYKKDVMKEFSIFNILHFILILFAL
jgi:hypothetical protein